MALTKENNACHSVGSGPAEELEYLARRKER